MPTKKITDIRDEISDHLLEIERSMHWLAKKADIPYGTIYSIFKQKHISLSQLNLDKINAVLETEFSLV